MKKGSRANIYAHRLARFSLYEAAGNLLHIVEVEDDLHLKRERFVCKFPYLVYQLSKVLTPAMNISVLCIGNQKCSTRDTDLY
jgi:hypothetical protein